MCSCIHSKMHTYMLTSSTVSPFSIKNSCPFSIFVSIIEKSLVRIQEGGREKLKLMKARQVEFAVAYACILCVHKQLQIYAQCVNTITNTNVEPAGMRSGM